MKETRTKLLSLLVVLCMVLTLLPMAALAADAQFKDMPNDYSTAALQAAVTNGLLKGSGGQLRPAASLTRAEMATILNHAFGAAEKSDISGYTDVPAGAWYANEMAVAVHMKTLVGSGKKLNPNAPVTREEALTALASVLKLPAGSDTALAKYKDSAKVASWAKGSVAAMVTAGYASGDGANLNPTANITRADFAVIMNSVVKTYITKAGTYTDNLTGNVMVNVPGVVLKNITITGDLIIGDGVGSGDITLDGVTVTGRTVVRGGGVHSVKIINKSNVGTLTISKVDGEVRVAADASSSVEVVVINDGKDDVIVEGNVGKLEVAAAGVPVTVQGGTVGEVSVTADHASVTVAPTATVTTLTATGAQPTLTVQGTVTTLTADKTATGATVTVAKGAKVGTVNAAAEGAAISGEGTVAKANVTGNNVNVATSGTSVTVAKDVTGAKSGDKDLKGGTTTTTTGTTSPAGGGYADTTAPTVSSVALYSDDACTNAIVSGTGSALSTTTTSTVVKKVVVTMSEPVTLSGGTQAMVKFGDAAATAYGTIAVDGSKLVITPTSEWGIDYVGTMTFTLGSGVAVKDAAGNSLASDAAITLTVTAADTTAPTVSSVALYSDDACTNAIVSGTGSALSTTTTSTVVKKVVVTMSEPVTLSGGTQAMVKFGDAAATAYGTIAVDGSKLVITPTSEWGIDYVGTMTFTLGSGVAVKDAAGNSLASDAAITLSVDNTAPIVSSVTLFSDDDFKNVIASGIGSALSTTTTSTVVKKIVVIMSEPVTLSKNATAQVQYSSDGTTYSSIDGVEKYGDVGLAGDSKTLVIIPSVNWAIDQAGYFKFTLGSGVAVKDTAGNPLADGTAITLTVTVQP